MLEEFRTTGRARFSLLLALLMLSLALVSGCASAKLDDAAWHDKRLDMVWPQPPDKARIKLLRVVQGPRDLVEAPSGTIGKMFDFIVGAREDYLEFFTPQCIAADGNGLIYIADPSVGLVHVYNLATREVNYLFLAGNKRLVRPVGVALDGKGHLYVTDTQLGAVFKLRVDGSFIAELDGMGKLKGPAGIAVTSKGEKFVTDLQANKVFIFGEDDTLQRELSDSDFAEGFRMPIYVSVDKADNVYVTDTMNFTIRVFDSSGKYIRSIGRIGDSPGSFARPKGVATDSDQNIYVMDSILANFQIFNQKGQLLLYVGQEGSLPGEMMLPSGIFIDKNDRIYVSDTFNHRIQIYQYVKEDKAK